MVTEIRKIIFSDRELQEAIIAFNPRCNNQLPAGEIKSCKLISENGIKVLIRIQPLRSEGEKAVKVKDAYLAAALYNYCMSKKIPIPKKASKSLQIIGDNIALQINIDVNEKQIFEVVEDEADQDEDPNLALVAAGRQSA